jgi:type I restriction enzyme S subunit
VKLLDEADELRKLRAQTDRRTAALLPALFHEMFGDPRANSRAHRVVTLGSLCQKISDGTHKTPTYVSSGVPFVTVKNITTGQLDFSETKFISEKEHLELTKRTKPERGDVLVSKDGTIGVPCNVDTDREFSIFVSIALLKLRRELANSVFLTGQLNTDWVQAQIREGTKGIAIRHLHLRDFRTLKIILPPLPLQNEFAQRVTEIRELEAAQAASRQRLDALFQSMLHRAFQGDL